MGLVDTDTRAAGPFNYLRLVMRLRIPFAIATMVFAVLGLVSNYAGVDFLLRPLGEHAATHPVTAICLFALGFSAYRLKRVGATPPWRLMVGAGIIVICATRLMQAMLGEWAGAPDMAIFGPIAGFSGQFSVQSATILGAFALACVMRQGLGRAGLVFLVIGLATVSHTVLELTYGLTLINGNVGVFSLLGMASAAVVMLSVYIHRPFVRVAFLVGQIGTQTRVMALTAIAIPWLSGGFLHAVRDIGASSVPFEAAIISIITWSMLLILLMSASRLERTDVARRRAEREIAMLCRTDPVTKGFNRFGMSEQLEAAWVGFKGTGTQFGLLMLDVDYFRRLNETFGKGDGEGAVARVAQTVKSQLRDHDAFSRWSGEAFLILLKIKAPGDLAIVAHRLRAALEDEKGPFRAGLDAQPAQVVATFGMGEMADTDDGPREAVVRANASLQAAQQANGPDIAPTSYDMIADRDELMFEDDQVQDALDQTASAKARGGMAA